MDVSIVVPIHNGEDFLEECINSLLNQSYKDFELILVDDGSEDQSGKICDKYEKKDHRIKVVHKKNEGVTCARITGVEKASSDLITFVDADDWVDKHFLERLLSSMKISDADIVISGCVYEQGTETTVSRNLIKEGIYEGKTLIETVISRMLYYKGFYQFGIQPYMWNKLFRKRELLFCLKEIDIKIYDGEDVALVYPYLLRTERVVIINDCMYHYRVHEGSVSFKKRKDFYANISRLYLQLYKSCQSSRYFELMLPQIDEYMRRMVWLGTSRDIAEEDRFFFPFRKVPSGCRIVLYGAGVVGRVYHRQIEKTKYCKVISWIDRDYIELSLQGMSVEKPDTILKREFDYIIIANGKENVQEEMKSYLINLGIEKEIIITGDILN